MSQLLVGDVVRGNARVVPDRTATWMAGERYSYRELDGAANRLAWRLRELGIGHGDRIVSWANTRLDVLPLFVAAAKLGAVFAPLNAGHGVDEATPVAALARPRLMIADADHAEPARQVAKNAGIDPVVGLGPAGEARLDVHLDPRSEEGEASEPGCPELREADPHVILFTSGSTGAPKGVVLSHRASCLRTFQGVFRDRPERSVCMFPLFHMAAFTLALSAWQTRGEIDFVANATAGEILGAVQARRADRLYCIPAVWSRILAQDLSRWDLSSLREIDTGTSATPVELLEALKARFPGATLRVYYGSTEAGSATALSDADLFRKPGSVGLPSPGVELRLGEGGEICVRSPYLFDGYLDDPDATASALRDGWFHSGDVGSVDDEGYLSIVGRLNELIRTGGESVAPSEVEAVLADHPDVAELAIVGVPDPQWGAVVCAAVVPRAGSEPSLESLQAHCEGRLAGYKKPRRLERVDALPRTPATGQVQRTLLVEQILARSR